MPRPVNPENRRIQTALNYFGFDAGVADGMLGRRSKAAVSGYQSFLGLNATGELTEVGKDNLLAAYDHALANPTAAAHVIAASPHGVRGLLLPASGALAAQPFAAPDHVAPEQATQGAGQSYQPREQAVDSGTTPIPSAPPDGSSDMALSQYCHGVEEYAAAHGGYVEVGNITDPWRALGEQFCFARDDAILAGDDLIIRVQGLSDAQITEQCRGLGGLLAPYVAALPDQPQGTVLAEMRQYTMNSGMTPTKLMSTSRICLAVGYRDDFMDVAIGSALMLSALGEILYSELLGHHLSLGIGVTRNMDLAGRWYDPALQALEAGQPPLFDPFNPARVTLIRTASDLVKAPDVVTR